MRTVNGHAPLLNGIKMVICRDTPAYYVTRKEAAGIENSMLVMVVLGH